MPQIFDASFKKNSQRAQTQLEAMEAVNHYSQVMRSERPSKNPFHAFAPKPLTVKSFDSQLDNEFVLLLLRRHPITQLPKILALMFLLLLPFFFPSVDFFIDLPGNFKTAVNLLWYLLAIGFALETFLTWYYNVYIVTDERIIDLDFLSLIYKNVSAAKIDNIEDITAETSGAIQSLFDFGTVFIQTAAEKTQFEFEEVPHPTRVTQFLNEMLLQEEKEKIEGRVN